MTSKDAVGRVSTDQGVLAEKEDTRSTGGQATSGTRSTGGQATSGTQASGTQALRLGLLGALCASVVFLSAGCAAPGGEGYTDPFELARQAQALGIKARITGIWGSGHAGGFAFNFTGSNGFFELIIEPPGLNHEDTKGGVIKQPLHDDAVGEAGIGPASPPASLVGKPPVAP